MQEATLEYVRATQALGLSPNQGSKNAPVKLTICGGLGLVEAPDSENYTHLSLTSTDLWNWVPTYKAFGNIFCQEAEGAMENAVHICKCGYHQIWHQAIGRVPEKMRFFSQDCFSVGYDCFIGHVQIRLTSLTSIISLEDMK